MFSREERGARNRSVAATETAGGIDVIRFQSCAIGWCFAAIAFTAGTIGPNAIADPPVAMNMPMNRMRISPVSAFVLFTIVNNANVFLEACFGGDAG